MTLHTVDLDQLYEDARRAKPEYYSEWGIDTDANAKHPKDAFIRHDIVGSVRGAGHVLKFLESASPNVVMGMVKRIKVLRETVYLLLNRAESSDGSITLTEKELLALHNIVADNYSEDALADLKDG